MNQFRSLSIWAVLVLLIALTPAFAVPSTKMIRPGASVGLVSLSDTTQMVEKTWGKPRSISKKDGRNIWVYDGKMGRVSLSFREKLGILATFTCYDSFYSVADAPQIKVGAPREDVLKAFPKPSRDNPSHLDYNDLGVHYSLDPRTDRVDAINVYKPGHSEWAK